jgi:hypothetical protein
LREVSFSETAISWRYSLLSSSSCLLADLRRETKKRRKRESEREGE